MKNRNIGIWAIFILIILPIILWILRMPLSERFSDSYSILTSLGQISGIIGMAMFIVVIILSSRLKFLENYFGGLNKIYFLHHFLGGVSLILLLFHPTILVIKFATISLHDAALFLLPGNNSAVTFGLVALLAMIILLVFTFFINFPYKTWKITHKFLGIAFFFAILHTFFVPSDVSLFLPLKIYMGFLVFVALFVFLYRTIFGNSVIKRYSYLVDRVKRLNDNVIEIVMSAKDETMNFQAGQYIFISFKADNINKEVHPFSISSGIFDEKLKIIVKSLGKYTNNLQNLKAGASAFIEGPFGVFSYLKSNYKNQIWIAGGIGITPFLSMAKSLKDNTYKIDLFYCVKNKDEIVSSEEFTKVVLANSNFRIIPFCSDLEGRINVQKIKNISGGISQKDFFLCGPPGMMKGLRLELLENDVSNENIHSEEFSF